MLHACCEPWSKFEADKTVFKEVRDVVHEAFHNTTDINELAESQLTFFIRDDGGQVVSAAYGKIMNESEIYLHYLATKRTCRKLGYGSTLLYWLVNSKKFAFNRIVVNVDKKEKPILRYYRNRGFQKMKQKDRRERNLERTGESTFSFHGPKLTQRDTPDVDCIEWYDPLKIDYIKMCPGLKKDYPPRCRFHLVMGGWKFEDKKWRLPPELSATKVELQNKLDEKFKLTGDSNFVVIVDGDSGVDMNKENVHLAHLTKDPIDSTGSKRLINDDKSGKKE